MATDVIDKIAWVEVNARRFLSARSRGRTCFYIPGGKREGVENDLATLAREIREELSVEIDTSSAEAFGIFEAQADAHSAGTRVRMTCYTATYQGKLAPAAEIEEMRWLDRRGAAISSPVDRLIIARMIELDLID